MKLFQAGDYAIWQKKRIVRLKSEILRSENHFMGEEEPIQVRFDTMLVAGLPDDEKRGVLNDTSKWLVRCDNTGEAFSASGADLIYINPMQVIALMAKKDEDDA